MESPLAPRVVGDFDDSIQSHSGEFHPVVSPNKKVVIDYTKFKTKMCRHYLMGLRCPFEDRCAFAHGDPQLRAGIEQAQFHAMSHACQPQSPVHSNGNHDHHQQQPRYNGSSSSSNSSGTKQSLRNIGIPSLDMAPPPPYTSFVSAPSTACVSSDDGSDHGTPRTPPAYPTRFRYDPYSPSGIVFAA